MVEHSTEKKIESLHKTEDADLEKLLYRLLVQKSGLLYFICRRGSWKHIKQRGKKIISFDPRGILKDREIDCLKFANKPSNKVSKNTYLIRVKLFSKSKKSCKNSINKCVTCKQCLVGPCPHCGNQVIYCPLEKIFNLSKSDREACLQYE